jgi:hypothetical protein
MSEPNYCGNPDCPDPTNLSQIVHMDAGCFEGGEVDSSGSESGSESGSVGDPELEGGDEGGDIDSDSPSGLDVERTRKRDVTEAEDDEDDEDDDGQHYIYCHDPECPNPSSPSGAHLEKWGCVQPGSDSDLEIVSTPTQDPVLPIVPAALSPAGKGKGKGKASAADAPKRPRGDPEDWILDDMAGPPIGSGAGVGAGAGASAHWDGSDGAVEPPLRKRRRRRALFSPDTEASSYHLEVPVTTMVSAQMLWKVYYGQDSRPRTKIVYVPASEDAKIDVEAGEFGKIAIDTIPLRPATYNMFCVYRYAGVTNYVPIIFKTSIRSNDDAEAIANIASRFITGSSLHGAPTQTPELVRRYSAEIEETLAPVKRLFASPVSIVAVRCPGVVNRTLAWSVVPTGVSYNMM